MAERVSFLQLMKLALCAKMARKRALGFRTFLGRLQPLRERCLQFSWTPQQRCETLCRENLMA